MGTRSITRFYSDDDSTVLVALYRQSDGYPEGHGADLAKFLDGLLVINGLTGNDEHVANGMGCLAAQVIGHLKKTKAGEFYIVPAPGEDQEYVYEVRPPRALGNIVNPAYTVGEPILVCRAKYDEKFEGPASGYAAWLNQKGRG